MGYQDLKISIKPCKVPTLGRNTACQLEYSDYHTVAAAFGAKGFLLSDSEDGGGDEDRIRSTLTEAMEITTRENQAVLINALIGKTDFRDGSISV